ncbi:MAG: hypothetical protein P8Y60_17660, partial [Calditrichota bacterium]
RQGEVRYENTAQSGQYSLYTGEQMFALYSVNIPLVERDIARMSKADWQVFFGEQFGGFFQPNPGDATRVNAGLVYGRPLWQWLFAVALFCVLAEMILIRTQPTTQEENSDIYE